MKDLCATFIALLMLIVFGYIFALAPVLFESTLIILGIVSFTVVAVLIIFTSEDEVFINSMPDKVRTIWQNTKRKGECTSDLERKIKFAVTRKDLKALYQMEHDLTHRP